MKARFQIEPRDDGWTLTCYYAADDVAFRAYYPEYDEALEEAERFMEREERFQEIMQEQREQDVGALREAGGAHTGAHTRVRPYRKRPCSRPCTDRWTRICCRIWFPICCRSRFNPRPHAGATKKARPCRSAGTAQNK